MNRRNAEQEQGAPVAWHLLESCLTGLLEQVVSERQPADQLLRGCIGQYRIGSSERRLLSEAFFFALRHGRLLQHGLSGSSLARVALDCVTGRAQLPDAASLPPALRWSLPDWLWQRWQLDLGHEEAAALAEAVNQRAPCDVRVSRLQGGRDRVLARMDQAGIRAQPTPWSPDGIRMATALSRQELSQQGLDQGGLLEVQDEGSQLISLLVEPQPGWQVIDLCAGTGGKTLHLADLLGRSGKIIATDHRPDRLQRLRQRLKSAGVRHVEVLTIQHERDSRLHGWRQRADAVLVDAPCSGSGTLRRRPELKWRLQEQECDAFHWRQLALLDAAAMLVRPGGRLVYATCSLLARENEQVVQAFMAGQNQFRVLPVGEILARQGIDTTLSSGPFMQLWPHRSQTDGFFAAVLQRLSQRPSSLHT
ncbi:MAG: RsmB/NOP family class I SAM-dependent RNA methyltransferase [Magnetococcales bacterium]|nr:RsmB/NOP family class I SAM-dependent RNA methyltransferase [Magnetococcales bacterium]